MEEVSGGVDGARPRLQLPRPVLRNDPQDGVNRFGRGAKADGPHLGEGQLQLVPLLDSPKIVKFARIFACLVRIHM